MTKSKEPVAKSSKQTIKKLKLSKALRDNLLRRKAVKDKT